MLSLFQRIPSIWIALIIGAIGAALYLRYLTPKSPENDFVRDKMFTVVVLFILFSRFSSVIIHPSGSIQTDLLSLLSDSSSHGWIVGIIASVLFSFIAFLRTKRLNNRSFFVLAEAISSGSVIFFGYQAYINLDPFRMEDIMRTVGSVILMWLIRKQRAQLLQKTHWLWGGYGLLLLLTSAYVPHVNRTLLLTTSQWMFVLVMAVAIYVESKGDLINKGHVT